MLTTQVSLGMNEDNWFIKTFNEDQEQIVTGKTIKEVKTNFQNEYDQVPDLPAPFDMEENNDLEVYDLMLVQW